MLSSQAAKSEVYPTAMLSLSDALRECRVGVRARWGPRGDFRCEFVRALAQLAACNVECRFLVAVAVFDTQVGTCDGLTDASGMLARRHDVALAGDHVPGGEDGRIVGEASVLPVREVEELSPHGDALDGRWDTSDGTDHVDAPALEGFVLENHPALFDSWCGGSAGLPGARPPRSDRRARRAPRT